MVYATHGNILTLKFDDSLSIHPYIKAIITTPTFVLLDPKFGMLRIVLNN